MSVVLPLTAPSVAEIVVVPALTAVASPAAFTVATAVLDDAHVTWLVRFCVLPSEYVPVAVNCCVPPTVTVGFAGRHRDRRQRRRRRGLNTTSTQ